jgi:soluble lytic murein transglycosylase
MRQSYYENINRAAILTFTLGVCAFATAAWAGPGTEFTPPKRVGLAVPVTTMAPPYQFERRLPQPTRKPATSPRPVGRLAPMGHINNRPAPRNTWERGLAAYQKGDMRAALRAFVAVADQKKNDHFERAAGAFWASRAADRLGYPAQANELRTIAASYDRSFYGQIARTQLGQRTKASWDAPRASLSAMNRLGKTPEGQAAQAHVAAGRLSAADQVLIKLTASADADLRLAILNFAVHHGLPATALRLAHRVQADTGVAYRAAFYPLGAWLTTDEFRVDPALVHAIILQESGFNTDARSHMGAVGLMQLLPSTANYVVKVKAGGASDRDLTRSLDNLELGQHYLEYLLAHPAVEGDMIKMLVAYNAGPGNLTKWQRELGIDASADPLLFIETIPAAETRAYVEKVMAAFWIYRDRFGQKNPTLAALGR